MNTVSAIDPRIAELEREFVWLKVAWNAFTLFDLPS
jgi:hypothetical protein